MRFLLRLIATAAALWAAVWLVPGITHTGPLLHLLGVAAVFGLVNAFIRPIIMMLTCPVILLTFGLFIFVLNGLMLLLTAALSDALGIQFHVSGLLPALLGGIVVGVTSAVLNLFVKDPKERGR
jgi:putative membrane protein